MRRFTGRHKLATAIAAAFAVAVAAVVVAAGGGRTPAAGHGLAGHGLAAAPDFTVAVLGDGGQRITLSRQYAGEPVIVNFWASWCDPCQRETPLLASWYRRQHSSGQHSSGQHDTVNLIGLDENDVAASALKFARAKGVTYPLGSDPRLQVADAYGVAGAGIPQTFFLNARHQVVDHVYGALTAAGLARGLRLARG